MRREKNVAFRAVLHALLPLCLALLCLSGFAEEEKTYLTGYFTGRAFMRPEMKQTTDYVDYIPEYTVVTVEVIDADWAVYTSPAGKTGYIRTVMMQPVPEYEREEEWYAYSTNRIEIRSLPNYDAQKIYKTLPDELLTVDGRMCGLRTARRATCSCPGSGRRTSRRSR